MAVTAVTTVAIVGAGIAGLAAAWELQRAGVALTLLESERRAGGVIVTERRDGFIVEGGPDGFLAAEPDLPALARELGIADRLVDQLARGAAVWTGSRFEPLAEGSAAALLGIQVREEDLGAGVRSFAGGMARVAGTLRPRAGPAHPAAGGANAAARVPGAVRWRAGGAGACRARAAAPDHRGTALDARVSLAARLAPLRGPPRCARRPGAGAPRAPRSHRDCRGGVRRGGRVGVRAVGERGGATDTAQNGRTGGLTKRDVWPSREFTRAFPAAASPLRGSAPQSGRAPDRFAGRARTPRIARSPTPRPCRPPSGTTTAVPRPRRRYAAARTAGARRPGSARAAWRRTRDTASRQLLAFGRWSSAARRQRESALPRNPSPSE